MLLELLNHAILDSTILYVYLGSFILAYCFVYLSHLSSKRMFEDYAFINERQASKNIAMHVLDQALILSEGFREWFIIIYQQVSEKDDDEEDANSCFTHTGKIRGGQICKRTTYSLSFVHAA